MGFKTWLDEWRADRKVTREVYAEVRKEYREAAAKEREAKEAVKTAHDERLARAAGVSSVLVVCHRDTWNFVQSFARGRTNYIEPRPEDVVEGPDGMIEARVSGVRLVHYLEVMDDGSRKASAHMDRPVARRIYTQLAKVVDTIDPDAATDAPVPPIVLDDRAAPATDTV